MKVALRFILLKLLLSITYNPNPSFLYHLSGALYRFFFLENFIDFQLRKKKPESKQKEEAVPA